MPESPPNSVPSNCVPVGMMRWPRNWSCGVPAPRSALSEAGCGRRDRQRDHEQPRELRPSEIHGDLQSGSGGPEPYVT